MPFSPLFLQTPPVGNGPPPAPSGGGGGITINLPTVDWTALVPQIVGLFFDAVGKTINDTMHKSFDGVWGSSANIIGQTDPGSTWDFGPIHDQVQQVQTAAQSILLLGLILLGMKAMLGGIVRRHEDPLSDFVNGLLLAVIMVAGFPVLVPQLIAFTNQVTTSIATIDLSKYMSQTFGGQNPIVEAVLFIVLVFFGLRLIFYSSWRIVVLAVLLPVGMLAAALYALPFTRWLFVWWAKAWGGLLFAQIPSVLALSIGALLFAHGTGVMAFMGAIAAMQVAVDMYKILPGIASAGGGGSPWGFLPLAQMGMRMATPHAAAPAAMTTREVAHHFDYGY